MKQVLLLVLFFVSRVFVCVFEIVFVIADGITRMVLDWLLGCVFARVSLVSGLCFSQTCARSGCIYKKVSKSHQRPQRREMK